ncbi:nucleoside triphosphate pyrophosphohydrolase [Candidatus Woesearchaeota archaeon]|nr:nucleoside triphosphate pyrophosphohydrolase [Candidatus Woesearchaeota archaeon]
MPSDKLVRDRIPEIIRKDKQVPKTHVADAVEYRKRLLEKLYEEVDEFSESGDVDELADILEVVKALSEEKKVPWKELERMRMEKAERRGGFSERIVLDRIS